MWSDWLVFCDCGFSTSTVHEPWTSRCSSWIWKSRGTRDQLVNIRGIIRKSRAFQKNIYFCLSTTPKPLIAWITPKCGKFWKRWEYPTTLTASWEICIQVKKQQLELDMEQQTGSQGCILSSCLFNLYGKYIMRNAGLDEAQAGIRIARRSINNLRYADDTTLWQKVKN